MWTDSWEGLWWTSRPIVDFFGDWTVVESSDLLSYCAGLLNGSVVEPWDFLWTEPWGPKKLLGIGLWEDPWNYCGSFLRIVAKTSRSTVIRIFCGLNLGALKASGDWTVEDFTLVWTVFGLA